MAYRCKNRCPERLYITTPESPATPKGCPTISFTTTYTVLCRGSFPEWSDESTTLKVDGSVVKLAKSDLFLLRSGRPRRFLSPWPVEDSETELRSVSVALAEIHNLKEMAIASMDPGNSSIQSVCVCVIHLP